MEITEEREIDLAVQRMIESINDVLRRTEKAAREKEVPALFSLREACEFAGKSYSTVKRKNHLQPMCGYYDHWEDTPQRRNPKWTREQVTRWAEVTKPQRIEYVEELLYENDTQIAAGALHMLIKDSEAGNLPEYIESVIDSYTTEIVEGRFVRQEAL